MTGPKPDRILVVDDEPDMAESCAFLLERQGYVAVCANSGEAALDCLANGSFALVVSDVKMPRMSGLELLSEIKSLDPDIEVLLITGYPEIQAAVAAIKQGAFDYLTKPYVERDLMDRVGKAVAHRHMKERNEGLKERLRSGPDGRRLIYKSRQLADLVEMLARAARTEASVLIEGESGTGKELLAHHLHDRSPRAEKPFVPVDCAAIPSELFESELFGHKKGAFSGAIANKMGLFQVADGGTLFLDELAELPLPFQSKLLRAVQERKVRPVGGNAEVDVDVRIVAATNRNLVEAVQQGQFRQDLFYRLNVVRLLVPPLRDRPEDIEELANSFLSGLGASAGVEGFAGDVVAVLRSYAWPGNVRELRNAIERGVTLAGGNTLRVEDLPAEVRGSGEHVELGGPTAGDSASGGTFQERKARTIAALEAGYLEKLLRKHRGNVTRSADEAGMKRSALQKLLQKHSIKSSDFR
ncbi:MAG: sigma-54 dependent transcriptional regulator [Planctomycetota bacterium]|nr:sigma-54 dependent transcriptional regulator [Planctomycetota bacterium]